jgi:hypothetical protein
MTRHYFKNRYQTASDVLKALENLESPTSNSSYTPTEVVGNRGYSQTKVEPVIPDYSKHAQTVVEPPSPRPAPVEPDNRNAKPAASSKSRSSNNFLIPLMISATLLIIYFAYMQVQQVRDWVHLNLPVNSKK